MKIDVRINTQLFAHPKYRRLKRRLGWCGCAHVVHLFAWVAANRPDGELGSFRGRAWHPGRDCDLPRPRADYRRKTAEAAEAKREAQAERERIAAERSHYANHLDTVLHSLQTQLIGDQQALAHLAETDQAEWVRQNAAFQQRYANYQAAVHERQALANRMTAEQEREVAEWRKTERDKLHEKLPEWKDPQKAAAEQRLVAEYLIDQGYSQDDLKDLFDHRALVVAREAALWRQHLAAKASVKEKQVKTEPGKALKPGAAQPKPSDQTAAKVDQLRAKAKRTGNQDDIAAYLIAKQG